MNLEAKIAERLRAIWTVLYIIMGFIGLNTGFWISWVLSHS